MGGIPGLGELLDLAPRAICWMPANAFLDGDDAPWAAVLGPVVAQWCARGVAIVCLPLTAEAAPRVLGAARDGAVVGLDPAA